MVYKLTLSPLPESSPVLPVFSPVPPVPCDVPPPVVLPGLPVSSVPSPAASSFFRSAGYVLSSVRCSGGFAIRRQKLT